MTSSTSHSRVVPLVSPGLLYLGCSALVAFQQKRKRTRIFCRKEQRRDAVTSEAKREPEKVSPRFLSTERFLPRREDRRRASRRSYPLPVEVSSRVREEPAEMATDTRARKMSLGMAPRQKSPFNVRRLPSSSRVVYASGRERLAGSVSQAFRGILLSIQVRLYQGEKGRF